MSKIINVTDETFESEVINSSIPVLVDFWAVWCGPCKAINPHLEAIANDFFEKVKIAKVNVDESTAISPRYNVRSIPTLLLIKGGAVVDQMVGNPGSKSKIEDFIKKHM